MFFGCSSLISLDLSTIDTSSIINMKFMFSGCSSLTSLDLSKFDTSSVTDMNSMFSGCSSLISLDLSNINTSQAISMNYMFSGCSSLTSLDLSFICINEETFINYIFNGCSNLEYINLNNAQIDQNKIMPQILLANSQNLIVCSNALELENIYSQNFQFNCINSNNSFLEDNNQNNCYSNNSDIDYMNKCKICGSNYYMKDDLVNNSNINCYEMIPEDILSDTNIINTNINNSTELSYDAENKTDLIQEDTVSDTNINNFTDLITELINDVENRTEAINNKINNIINEFNMTDIDSGKDKKVVEKNLQIILTSTLNQKINEKENNISMNLGQCETILKNNYNISLNDSLYILQIISEEDGMKIPKMEYEVYYPLNGSQNLAKLNLSLCKDTKVEISIKVKINETLDKYNSSSDYYNDVCSVTTSNSGTDISLKDRRNEFIDNDMSLCEKNCDLINYNPDTKKVKCSCDIKVNIPSDYDIKFNKKDFFKNFVDINNIFNLNILKCYKKVLKIKKLIYNYGFWIIASVVILYIITIFIFCIISYIKLKKEITSIYFSLKNLQITIKLDNINSNNKAKKKYRHKNDKKYLKKNNSKY